MTTVHPSQDAPPPPNYAAPPAYSAQGFPVAGLNIGLQAPNYNAEVTWYTSPVGSTGLDMLNDVGSIKLEQIQDMIEAMTFIDQPNKYRVLDDDDKQLFYMEEENTGSIMRHRDFNVVAKNAMGEKVFNIKRPGRMWSYCFFCCACCEGCKSEVEVKGDGKKFGKTDQNCSVCNPSFKIEDDDDKDLFDIDGRIACCNMKSEYGIMSKDGKKELGVIKKYGEGLGKGRNKYKIKFPKEASAKEKALIIGTAVLFDYRFHYLVNPYAQGRRRR